MSKKNGQTLGSIATVGLAIVTLHGITTRRWSGAHTLLTVLSVVAAVASL